MRANGSKPHLLNLPADGLSQPNHYKAIFDASPLGILLFDVETGVFIDCNVEAARLLNCSKEMLRGCTPSDLSPELQPDGLRSEEKVAQVVRSILTNGRYQFEWTHCSPNRPPFLMEVTGSHLDLNGRSVIVVQWTDISARKNAEHDRQRLFEILSRSTDYVGTCDMTGKLLYHNPAALRIIGLAEDFDISTLHVKDMHPKRVAAQILSEAIPTAIREGMWRGESLLLHRDGREIPVMQTVMTHYSPSGGPEFLSTIMHDMTEFKQAEQERELLLSKLSSSNAVLDRILRSAGNMIIATDLHGVIQYFNPAAEKQLGYSPREIEGKATPMLIHDEAEVIERARVLSRELGREVKPGFRVFVEKCEAGEADRREWTYIRKDGSRFPVLLTVTAILNKEGKPDGYLGTIADLSEKKQLEVQLRKTNEELMRSNRDLEQFAYIASHDLQAPLRTLSVFGRLISEKLAANKDADVKEWLGHSEQAVAQMCSLIKDLLDYSRVGESASGKEWLDPNETVQDVARIAGLEKNGTKLVVEPLPRIWGHRTPLYQLIQNLLQNAQKFQKPGIPSEIRVACREEKHQWVFSVQDNGIGIQKEHFDRIFQLFQRLHRNEEYVGTGIGLAICRKAVELHGGKIWVKSTPGEGSTFYFTLPKHETETIKSRSFF